jgi:hypothetical protein
MPAPPAPAGSGAFEGVRSLLQPSRVQHRCRGRGRGRLVGLSGAMRPAGKGQEATQVHIQVSSCKHCTCRPGKDTVHFLA